MYWHQRKKNAIIVIKIIVNLVKTIKKYYFNEGLIIKIAKKKNYW